MKIFRIRPKRSGSATLVSGEFSNRPPICRILEFYFNAQQRGNGPIQFKEDTTVIDFQEESTKYTAALTTVWDGENSGLHLSVHTESTPKVFQVGFLL